MLLLLDWYSDGCGQDNLSKLTIYCLEIVMLFIDFFQYFIFLSLSILLTRRKASNALYLGQPLSDYLDLLSKIQKYCCPVETFYLEI